ncbi:50S ribosomal protein L11 methyltransferase [Ideonella dechloratans]|uniref:Ribosomal protein L11 methyltransferase n=1 Tax=Ideonella dechloratans TaxID=36863 RepID=A0A643FIZ6_IDEDE|nr:50S ribosomal protein L11 methyltransferase [Ideonella dechloratans]KAB0585497.1 50S ribosomal protein L11 methyltransferase [Ideonella dechloratans]UFU09388.1 50S ribosomal protein L11 methyltransferase [Ideonella dechloratans]
MFELVLSAPETLVEPVSEALMNELEALSVSVEDADADTDAEKALFGEPGMPAARPGWNRSTLKALFQTEEEASQAATLLLAQEWATELQVQALQPVVEQDWVRLTQSQFSPVEITERFWIVPSWHEPPAQAREVIRLDPGLAFGTGTHPTTRMCLRWIARQAPALAAGWDRVLDYGCGSGILAIGAALHGARAVDAVDIDPAAVESTLANAQANGVTVQAGLPELAQGEYPLVLANILATPLKLLAPLLCGHVRPGGHLVLAGILERQAEELQAAYAPWLPLQVLDSEDGWILMGAARA